VGVVALVITGISARDRIAEGWYRWHLERETQNQQWDLAEEYSTMGLVARRVAKEWYLDKADDPDLHNRRNAVVELARLGVLEALPKIIEAF